jgi:hypothetical protein
MVICNTGNSSSLVVISRFILEVENCQAVHTFCCSLCALVAWFNDSYSTRSTQVSEKYSRFTRMLCNEYDPLHLVYNYYALHYCLQYIQTGYSALAVVCDVVPASNLRKKLGKPAEFCLHYFSLPACNDSDIWVLGDSDNEHWVSL